MDQLCFEPPCLPLAESCMAFSLEASGSPAKGLKTQSKKTDRGLQCEHQFHCELERVGDAPRRWSRGQRPVASAQQPGDAPPLRAEVGKSRIGLLQRVLRMRRQQR